MWSCARDSTSPPRCPVAWRWGIQSTSLPADTPGTALTKLGWVDPLRSRLLPTVDVRAALRLVELGEAAGGIVYETDAAASDRVEVIARFDELGIRYPLAACRGAAPAARLLLEYFRRPESEALFAQSGFAVLR